MDSTSLLVAATAIGALAFLARTAVLLGREPGGVDSWYYLCYARAFRKAPGLKVGLPQYLLQDQQQSYAPIFPSLLALIPDKFELVSPVWRERVEDAARRHGVRYLIIERSWVDPAVLALDAGCARIAQEDGFDMFDLQAMTP